MTLYQVKDSNDKIVGETANTQELTSFLASHPGHTSTVLAEVTKFESTLPKLQEGPVVPKGDLLQQ